MEQTGFNESAQRWVALIDILGFKRIMRLRSPDHLASTDEEFLGIIKDALSHGKNILWRSCGKEWFGPDNQQATENTLRETDSVLIWTEDSSAKSLANIVNAVGRLLKLSLIAGIPLRGAISVGTLSSELNQQPPKTHDFKQSPFGKALMEAEKMQQWSGCEITRTAVAFFNDNFNAKQSLLDTNGVVFYPIPRKTGEAGGYAVDWVNNQCAGVGIQQVRDAFAPPTDPDQGQRDEFMAKEWPHVHLMLCNTCKFVDHVRRPS